MSLLVSTAQFIRNNTVSLKLSFVERAMLSTLAFYIGKNQNTWVTQSTLIKECAISRRHLINTLKSLSDKKIIKISPNGKQNFYEMLFYTPAHAPQYVQKEINNEVHPSAPIPDSLVHSSAHIDPPQVHPSAPSNSPQVHSSALDPSSLSIYKKQRNNKIKSKEEKQKYFGCAKPAELLDDVWEDFEQHRRELKAPLSYVSTKRSFQFLAKMQALGQDMNEIVLRSITNGWKGLFPLPEGWNAPVDRFGYKLTRAQASRFNYKHLIKVYQEPQGESDDNQADIQQEESPYAIFLSSPVQSF